MGDLILVKNWDLDTCFLYDDLGGSSGSSCVFLKAPLGVLSFPPRSGPSSAEAGNAPRFFPFCAQCRTSSDIQACCNSFLYCMLPRGTSETLFLYVRNFLELLCSCMAWKRLFFLAEFLPSWLLLFNLSLSRSVNCMLHWEILLLFFYEMLWYDWCCIDKM